jgi:uncharacterized protein YecA (UPF0149 family)
MSAKEIHHELFTIYDQNITNEGTVRQWCKMFKMGKQMLAMESVMNPLPGND